MTGAIDAIIDAVILSATIGLSIAALVMRDLFKAVVAFIVVGLFMALAWVRLAAPDVALAEAAVGAGITGVLLLDAARHMRDHTTSGGAIRPFADARTLVGGLALTAAVAGMLVAAVWDLPSASGGLTEAVAARMPESGVKHPVTAVLLNFRGYDTWLELGVLLLAAFGVLLVQPADDLSGARRLRPADRVLWRSIGVLLPLAVLGSGYLLWVGKYGAGGAFQAGVVLGSVLVLVWLSGSDRGVILSGVMFRVTLVAGFVAFLGSAVVLAVAGPGFLTYPVAIADGVILFIEGCATLSIAWIMATLILGQAARDGEPGGAG